MEKLAVIILNYNDYEQTINCIDNLIDIDFKSNIVIVDNKSENNSFDILQEKYYNYNNIHVIQSEKNGGYSYGNNFGMKYAIKNLDVDYLCIMNPDVIVTYNSIFNNLVNKLEKNDDISAISAVMILNNKFNYNGMCWDLPTNKTIYKNHIMFMKNSKRKREIYVDEDGIAKVDVIPGSFFIIKKNDLEKINFLDEKVFLYNEENLLSLRLRKIDKNVALSISDFYFHNHINNKEKLSLKKFLDNNQIGYESRKYLCKLYYSKNSLFKLKIANFFNIMYIFFRSIIK